MNSGTGETEGSSDGSDGNTAGVWVYFSAQAFITRALFTSISLNFYYTTTVIENFIGLLPLYYRLVKMVGKEAGREHLILVGFF